MTPEEFYRLAFLAALPQILATLAPETLRSRPNAKQARACFDLADDWARRATFYRWPHLDRGGER